MPLYRFVDPFIPDGLMRFTDKRAALGMSTILMMTIAFLSIALVLALYRALRESNLKFALFGSVLGVTGYIVTALGDASTFFAFAPISDLNQAPAATPEEPKRLGDKSMYLRFRLDDGSILQMSDIGENEVMAQGPFLVGEATEVDQA